MLSRAARAGAKAAHGASSNSKLCSKLYSSSSVLSSPEMHGTTILAVRKDSTLCMIGDGQVSLGSIVVKPNAKKVRRLRPNIVTGFAGSTADAFTLLERLESRIEAFEGQGITRPCVELAKAWRTDKYLRRLEAVLLVADRKNTYELTGNGDVLESSDGIMGVGSGGAYALAAARALKDVEGMGAEEIARKAMEVASDMCVYTNKEFVVEVINLDDEEEEGKEESKSSP
eukprot:CAMPEP_0182517734 /NCGR_PEP_ID=MMETSP1321-20130603/42858_1 /TAXON_ID=91990 /ORGANISM="Bolidomonas sp., Strain RCC1657" /LENGTH=228 /DNA_ID=CAMNT_0024725499 /DNA_START=37 /DNA_END=720 /DNA_ORIENTATION=+